MEKQMAFDKFGVMLDCSRNAVMKPEKVKLYIDILADCGYNCLMLYTEETYEIEGRPYFGHNRGRYSIEELQELDAYGKEKGIELIPCIQTLAHLGNLMRWPEFSKICDCNDILLAGEEKTYALIDDMFASLEKAFTSRTVNIGMDEAHMLGRGRYQDLHGFEERFDILLQHLQKVSDIAKKHGFKLLMWGDMFFRLMNEKNGGGYYDEIEEVPEEVKNMIPDNVTLIYWDYYSVDQEHYEKNMKNHSMLKEDIWFAGGLWTWTGFAPHNQFSMDATASAFEACKKHGVKDVILTVWGDNGGECSRFGILPSLYYAAAIAKGETDLEMIKKGFEEKFKISFDDFCLLDMPVNKKRGEIPVGAEKYFLYNDCFMGLFDSIVQDEYEKMYQETAERLQNISKEQPFYPLFVSMEKLAEVLSLKCSIGLRTRKAYEEQDQEKMAELIPMYTRLAEKVKAFYEAYEAQWMWENKPHGFDVQDARLGGLIMRIEHCQKRLQQYLDGKITKIEELEEPLLDVACRENSKELVQFNSWALSITSNNI